ncbi:hypothetical protein E5288_WYG021681 [Bos mutus]|uniref:Gastrin-releasing peptide n=1 Tax=Bos mutus TaxID=72004 RepID=A0A6B0S9N3_9CETA|nr:hypothetical protein [Bos mutus]
MRGREVPLVLLALVLCLAPRGWAAPVTAGRGGALAKMYTRGNHWAVGHLMGKKSVAESPQLHEEESVKEQLREYAQWEEATRNLLSLLQAKAARGHQMPPWEPLSIHQPAWDSEDVSNFKDTGRPGSSQEERGLGWFTNVLTTLRQYSLLKERGRGCDSEKSRQFPTLIERVRTGASRGDKLLETHSGLDVLPPAVQAETLTLLLLLPSRD